MDDVRLLSQDRCASIAVAHFLASGGKCCRLGQPGALAQLAAPCRRRLEPPVLQRQGLPQARRGEVLAEDAFVLPTAWHATGFVTELASARKHKRKNYYEVLGVPSVASQLEIKKAIVLAFFFAREHCRCHLVIAASVRVCAAEGIQRACCRMAPRQEVSSR